MAGVLLIVIGFLFFLEQAGVDLEAMLGFWPVVFIGLGVWMIWAHLKKERDGKPPEDPGAP